MTPSSVLLVADYFHPHRGGIESHVHTLARHLEHAGVRVGVATPFPGQESVDGVRVHRLPAPLLPGVKCIWTTHAAAPFLTLLRRERFALVHCHSSIFSPAAAAAAYLAHCAGLPTVITFHSILGHYARPFALLDRLTRWTDLPLSFTAVSDSVASDLGHLLGARPIAILPPAFESQHWQPVEVKPDRGTFRIVSTMRLANRKRPGVLIDVIADVKERLAGSRKLRVRVIGDGGERAYVERMIAQRRLGDEVTLLGTLTREQIRDVYAEADAFVLPSIQESFGLAVLEARAVGLPIVVLASSGAARFIRHGREGLIAQSDGDLAAALVRLANSPELHQRIATHNRETRPSFCREESVRLHQECYADAIARRASGIARGGR